MNTTLTASVCDVNKTMDITGQYYYCDTNSELMRLCDVKTTNLTEQHYDDTKC